MASNIVAPTREEMDKLGFSHRVQTYLEDIDKVNNESNEETDSVLNLISSANSLISQLFAEIYSIKDRVENIENEVC